MPLLCSSSREPNAFSNSLEFPPCYPEEIKDPKHPVLNYNYEIFLMRCNSNHSQVEIFETDQSFAELI